MSRLLDISFLVAAVLVAAVVTRLVWLVTWRWPASLAKVLLVNGTSLALVLAVEFAWAGGASADFDGVMLRCAQAQFIVLMVVIWRRRVKRDAAAAAAGDAQEGRSGAGAADAPSHPMLRFATTVIFSAFLILGRCAFEYSQANQPGLSGSVRSSFVRSAMSSCLGSMPSLSGRPKDDYCTCRAEGLADRLSVPRANEMTSRPSDQLPQSLRVTIQFVEKQCLEPASKSGAGGK